MSFPIYDYRTDVRNVLVTPHIRSRFLRMEPEQKADLHSHDLGHEVFLILEGRAEFTIDGETGELGPGQMCIALVDQAHSVRVVGDEPMTMYLSVTPHIQPTHTGRTEEGGRRPLRFAPLSAYDVEADESMSAAELIDRDIEAAQTLARAAQVAADTQRAMGTQLKAALAAGDSQAAEDTRAAMWKPLLETFQGAYELADVWNELASRVAGD